MSLVIKYIHYLYTHMYIHNWPLQTFSQDYDLASHTTYFVCFNFIHEWWDLQFKIDSEIQFYSQSFCQKSTEGKEAEEIFSFLCLTWVLNSCLTSNKPTHYLLNYGDFYVYTHTHEECLKEKKLNFIWFYLYL